MIATLQTIGDEPRSTSTLACLRDDIEESVFQARRTMQEARPAVEWAKASGLIRPKTEAEIAEDLARMPKQKGLRGQPNSDIADGLKEETEEAFERYQAGTPIKFLAEEIGVTENALRQRFHHHKKRIERQEAKKC